VPVWLNTPLTDAWARVLRADGSVIPGLYAAATPAAPSWDTATRAPAQHSDQR
jgi:hypothetical protein